MISWSAKKVAILLSIAVVGPFGFESSKQPLSTTTMATALKFGIELALLVAAAVIAVVALQIFISKLPAETLRVPQWNQNPFEKSRPLDVYEFAGYGMFFLGIGYAVSQFSMGLDANCVVPFFIGIGLLLGVRSSLFIFGRGKGGVE